MRRLALRKFAFTMLELVFVIVVIGIISALVIPRMDRDNKFEAASQVLNHIKYTQHLAMTDDIYDDTQANWYFARWQIEFYNCGGYSVHSNSDLTAGSTPSVSAPNAAKNESAFDPQTKKRLWVSSGCATPATEFPQLNLAAYYDVASISTNAGTGTGCLSKSISLDNIGRPYGGSAINDVIKQNCEITLTFNDSATEVIRIHPETGYACLLDASGTNCI